MSPTLAIVAKVAAPAFVIAQVSPVPCTSSPEPEFSNSMPFSVALEPSVISMPPRAAEEPGEAFSVSRNAVSASVLEMATAPSVALMLRPTPLPPMS